MQRYEVLGAGIAAVDDLLYVDDYPPVNCKVPVLDRIRRGGGPACTAIAAASALGGRTAYVAHLGRNELSAYIESALRARGVDISHIVWDETSGPYHSVIVVDQAGRRNVFYDPSLYRPISTRDLSDALIRSASIFLLDHLTEPGLSQVAERVHSLGVPILSDLEGKSESALRLMAYSDFLVVPEEFAAWATGIASPRDACAALAAHPRRATVVTLGAEGCFLSTGAAASVHHFPAFSVEARDTNGCGDTFHGAFALAIARQLPVAEAIVFASAAAALKAQASTRSNAGWDSLPTLTAVVDLLRHRLRDAVDTALLQHLHAWSTTGAPNPDTFAA